MVLPILLTLFCDRCSGLFKSPALRPICPQCQPANERGRRANS